MTDAPSTAIAAKPFIDALEPYVIVIAQAVVGLCVAYGVALLQRWTGHVFTQAQVDQLQKVAEEQAGLLVAKSTTSLAAQSITAHSPSVAAAANYVANQLPGLLQATGRSPDDVAHMIAASIGHSSGAASAIVPVAAPIVSSDGLTR